MFQVQTGRAILYEKGYSCVLDSFAVAEVVDQHPLTSSDTACHDPNSARAYPLSRKPLNIVVLAKFSIFMPKLRAASGGRYGAFLFATYAVPLAIAEVVTLKAAR